MAFSSPSQPRWRWRIVSNAGEVIEESPQVFLSISAAVNEGRDRARELDIRDLSERSFAPRRGTSHLRSR